ncbi:MAG TPA: thioredoxin domain-containing protein [Solirubrobacterales bacterium]|nr:thioredoxin domain-containing protein [Solirubrobacterales bacterium]
MPIDVTESSFESEVIARSRDLPVVVDFWAEWCGPCKALSPALERAEAARGGKVVLAKVDTDANQQLAAAFQIQGIPAVKAFRDGRIVDEFTGALPPTQVEAFFDKLVPSRADELLAAGDELSLREAAELEPTRADLAVALAKARLARGAEAEALEAVAGHEGDFAADGIAARVRLTEAAVATDAFVALDRGDREAALDGLIETLAAPPAAAKAENGAAGDPGPSPDELRELLRRAIVGILTDLDPADPAARAYRRKLSAALG